MREGAQRLSASRRTPRVFLLFIRHQGVLTILRLLSGTIPHHGFPNLSFFRTVKLFLRHHTSCIFVSPCPWKHTGFCANLEYHRPARKIACSQLMVSSWGSM